MLHNKKSHVDATVMKQSLSNIFPIFLFFTVVFCQSVFAVINKDSRVFQINSDVKPDATLQVQNLPENRADTITYFQLCSSFSSENLTFINASTSTSTNVSYKISWGDGTADYTANSWTSLAHIYPAGHWILRYTVVGSNGISALNTYHIYIVSNPAVSLGSPGNTDNCSNVPLTFPITGTEKNPPGTTYTVSFNDGTAPLIFTQSPPKEITHVFTKTSCGITSYNGGISYPNSFSASIVASNSCGVSAVNVVPIYISTSPVVNFDLPVANVGISKPVYLTNTTTGYVNVGANCAVVPKLIWKITPSTGFTLTSGSLGNDFNSDNSNLWTKGSDIISPVFTVPGIYKIKLRVDTKRCGNDSIVKTICVEAPLNPQFSLDVNSGCSPVVVNTKNLTELSSTCTSANNWEVNYSADNCGTAPAVWNFVAGSGAQSVSPSFNLVTPGIYKIKLNAINSAGTFSTEQTVVVKQPPIASIEIIPDFCGTASFKPKATVKSCSVLSDSLSYLWSFPGGNPATSALADPGTILFNSTGKFKAILMVTNSCGSFTATSNEFEVISLPQVNDVPNQSKNDNDFSYNINFSGTENAFFEWTNDHPEIGLPAIGSGNIPPTELQNESSNVITATFTVTPKNKTLGCSGASKSFTITVNPIAELDQPVNLIVSNGTKTKDIIFTTDNTGGITTFSWINTKPEIGIPAASGNGNITAFMAVNNSNSPVVDTVTVTPFFRNGEISSSGTPKIFTITVLPSAQMIQPSNIEACNGILIKKILFKPLSQSGKTTFSWTNDHPEIGLSGSGNDSIASFNVLNTTTNTIVATVSVTPTYNFGGISNIGQTQKFTITINPGPVITMQPQSSFVCPGGQVLPLKIAYSYGTGSPSYQWFSNKTKSTTTGTIIKEATSDTYNPPTNIPGTTYYYCEISLPSGVCSNITSDVATVSINDAAIISQQPVKLLNLCVGGTIKNPLKVEFTGGSGTPSYQWYSNTTNSKIGGKLISGATNATFTPPVFTEKGNYFYFVEVLLSGDGCGSVLSDVSEINVVSDPVIVTQPLLSQTVCQETTPSELIVEATGGLGSYMYQWYENTVNDNISGKLIPDATSYIFTPPTSLTGTKYYYCQILQENGLNCNVTSSTASVIVNPIPVITKNPVSTTVCYGQNTDSLSVSYSFGVGSPTYQWFSNSSDLNTAGKMIAGANRPTYLPSTKIIGKTYYYCEISFAAGGYSKIVSDVASITIEAVAKIGTQNLVICSGSTLSLKPVTQNEDLVPENTLCTWSNPVVSPSNSITGASAQLVPDSLISQRLNNLTDSVATVSYTVTPVTGSCSGDKFVVNVQVSPIIKPNAIIKNALCFGANNGSIQTNVTGGFPFKNSQKYLISWTGPNEFKSTSKDLTGLKPGDYILSISDAGGCTAEFTYTISEPTEILISTDLRRDINCYNSENGEIAVTVIGGISPYNYTWTKDGLPFATTKNISNLDQGVYALLVTDANGWGIKTASYIISEPKPLVVTLQNQQNVLNYGDSTGTVTINVLGGTPIEINPGVFDYTYYWTGPAGFTSNGKNLTGIPAGKYHLTVTDANACSQIFNVEISQPQELTIEVTTKPMTCYSVNDASISLHITGGTQPFQIKWSNLGSGTIQENLSAGDYSVTVIDANNFRKTVNINIPEANFSIHPVTKNVTCFGAHDGSISLNISGGLNPISLVWDDNPTAGNQRNQLGPGIYTVTLHDGAPCNIKESFLISEPSKIEILARVINALECDNPNSGSINLTVSGGTPPYSYNWSTGESRAILTNLNQGKYFVIVSDSKGCTNSAQFEIIRQIPLSVSVTSENDLNCNIKKFAKRFTAHVTGGISPYQFRWSKGSVSGANNEIMEINQSSIVDLQVTDSLGCTLNYSFNSEVSDAGIYYDQTDCSKFSYQFNAFSSTVADNNYTYYWDFGDGEFASIRNPIHSFIKTGIYNVQLIISNSSCSINFETAIIVDPLTKLTLNREPKFCVGDSVTIHVKGARTYKWSNGLLSDSITIKHPGNYSVIGTSLIGCIDTLNFVASNYDLMNYSIFSNGDNAIENTNVQLWSENIPYSQYLWDFGEGKTDEGNAVNHIFKNNAEGYYDVKLNVTNPSGCHESSTKRIWIKMSSDMPNTFTPNGDGVNDVFMKGWKIKLYNRNGILLYEGTDGWDGVYKGQSVAAGVYYYVVYYPTDLGAKTETGYVRLVK